MKILTLLLALSLSLLVTGCGPSKAEREAQERARLELEEKTRREAEAANKAITEMNKKLGRKPPSIDLGVPAEPATSPSESEKSAQH
jgi:predicted component of type VI protein secretion system